MNEHPKLTELPREETPQGEALERLRARVRWFETNDADRFDGAEPLDAVALYAELLEDYEHAKSKYYEKRIRLRGTVSHLEPDEFGAPSFMFTGGEAGRCYALVVFPTKAVYDQVKEGDRAEIIGNVVFIREPYGLVVKRCELLEVSR